MAFFEKIKSAFSSEPAVAVAEPPSASKYVEWLPRYMLGQSCTEMRIDSTRPLPGEDEAPCVPSVDSVLNRLKVLCGLNPFRFAEPVDGTFEVSHANYKLKFALHFEDGEAGSSGLMRLTIHA